MQQEEGSKVVSEMAEEREATAQVEMTIIDAIDDAQWLRRTPDGVVGPMRLRAIVDTLLSALERSRCYYNAVRRGQEVFVLVEQDKAASYAIETWSVEARSHGCPAEKVEQAFRMATRWRHEPRITTKWPD